MRYVIVSSYPAGYGNGLASYADALLQELRRLRIETHLLDNRDLLPDEEFRVRVARELPRRFDPRGTLIGEQHAGHRVLPCPGRAPAASIEDRRRAGPASQGWPAPAARSAP